MTAEEAKDVLNKAYYELDYYEGRAVKVDFRTYPLLSNTMFDCTYGKNAMQHIITAFRECLKTV